MAAILEKKNGGPYSKTDQEKRRNRVYELHFEKGHSALKISGTLGVNRNTVNEDIRYWNGQISNQFGNDNLGERFCEQIERLDIQRRRLLDELEGEEDITKKIHLEKLLFDIDYKVTGLISKVLRNNLHVEELGKEEISDEEVFRIVRKICLSENVWLSPEKLDEKEILKQVILIKNCNEKQARNVFGQLKKMGIELFENSASNWKFDLLEFAVTRKIITSDERYDVYAKREEAERKDEQRYNEIEKRFEEKYGSDRSKWSKQIEDQMDEEMFGT